MSIIQKIKEDQKNARKNKDKELAGYLTTLMAEVQIVGKNNGNRETTDEEAVKVINKFYKNLNELFKAYSGITLEEGKNKQGDGEFNRMLKEAEVYKSYLPKQMTEDELVKEIGIFLQTETNPNMGSVMKYLKENFAGKYDGKMASKIVKDML